jgi:hypothetical protein
MNYVTTENRVNVQNVLDGKKTYIQAGVETAPSTG